MIRPSISVIIPAYQHATTLAACLDSVLNQTITVDEIIVVNDGSTDNTLEVLKPYSNKIILIDQKNQGGNIARNNGFEASTEDFVIFCDADIVMQTDMLEKMIDKLTADPDIGFVYSGFKFGWKKFSSFPYESEKLKKMNYIHTTSLIRRDIFPGFDPEIKRLQDWDLWLTMMAQGIKGEHIDEELFACVEDRNRIGISNWRPSFMYKIPWKKLGWMPKSIRKYNEAKQIILNKHKIN